MAALVITPVFILATTVLEERAALGFGRLRPRFCSIYEPYFWSPERHWKLVVRPRFPGTRSTR